MTQAPESWFRIEDSGACVILSVHVQPGARRTEAAGLHGGALKLRLAALPVAGKANDELIRFLAEAFGVPRSAVTLLSGETSRRKRVAVSGATRPPQTLLPGAHVEAGSEPRRRREMRKSF